MSGGAQPRRLVLLTLDGGGSGALAYDGEHVGGGRMIKIGGSQVAVTVALAVFAGAAWAVSRAIPQTAPSEPPRISPPDSTRVGGEEAPDQMGERQHHGGERPPSDQR